MSLTERPQSVTSYNPLKVDSSGAVRTIYDSLEIVELKFQRRKTGGSKQLVHLLVTDHKSVDEPERGEIKIDEEGDYTVINITKNGQAALSAKVNHTHLLIGNGSVSHRYENNGSISRTQKEAEQLTFMGPKLMRPDEDYTIDSTGSKSANPFADTLPNSVIALLLNVSERVKQPNHTLPTDTTRQLLGLAESISKPPLQLLTQI